MKNRFRGTWVLLALLVLMVVFVGCEEEDSFADVGTIEFTIVDEEYTIDAEFYVFTGVMPNEEDGGEFFWPVPWETLEQANWTHTIDVMNAGEWEVNVYATETSPGEEYDASNPPPSIRKIENITFTLEADTVETVEVTLEGVFESLAGETGTVEFTIPAEERDDADDYYAIYGQFYWRDDESQLEVWNSTETDTFVGGGTAEGSGAIVFTTDDLAAGRWEFTILALDQVPLDSTDTVMDTNILREQRIIYLKVDGSTSQTVAVDLEVPETDTE